MRKSARQGVAINPFYVLFCLYFFANLQSVITLGLGAPIKVDSEEFTFSGATIAISALALFSSLFACLVVYRTVLVSTKTRTDLVFGRQASLMLALLQLSFLVFNAYYGVNIAGVEDEVQGNVALRLFYSVVQPDLIFLIMCIGIRSDRWFWCNVGIYGISLLMRSWIGGFYLIAVVTAIRQYPISFSRKSLKYFGLVLAVGVGVLPLITSVKWFIRSGAGINEALDFLREIGYANYLVDSLIYVVNRFQHLGHVALLAENARSLREAYESGAFIPYWMDAAPQWLFLRLNEIDIVTINKFIVRYFFDSDNLAYASNPGISGWLFILQYKMVFFIVYLLGITLVPCIIILRYAGFKYFLLVSCFSLVYLFHGWIGAYANMVLYLLAFVLFRFLLVRPIILGRHRRIVHTDDKLKSGGSVIHSSADPHMRFEHLRA